MFRILLGLMAVLSVVVAQVPAPSSSQDDPPPGSIRGVVLDAQGAPIAEARVRVFGGPKPLEVSTNALGRYEIRGVPAGTHRMIASVEVRPQGFPVLTRKIVTLVPGQEVAGIDFQLANAPPEITGRVLDENGEVMAGVSVHLVGTEYQNGALRHSFRERTMTDDHGVYRFSRLLRPGVAYAVLAKPRSWELPAVSDAPTDPALRRRVRAATYYPKSPAIDGAERLVLRSGEVREDVDIHVSYAPSYCVEGVLTANGVPAETDFRIEEREATFGTYSNGGFYGRVPAGTTGPDGRIRVCDLQPGEYRITTSSPFRSAGPFFFATADFTIERSDIKNFSVTARSVVALEGEIFWDLAPPKDLEASPVQVSLHSLYRAVWPAERESLNVSTAVPGELSFASLLLDDYHVRLAGLPSGAYVKDITYGGASIQYRPLRVGSAVGGNARLRIVLAHDAALIKVKVRDEDDKPVGDAQVYLIPEPVGSEADLADRRIAGLTDQYGVFTSGALRPGEYTVVAARVELGAAPEEVAKLWRARPRAEQVKLAPDATTEVTVEVTELR